jgi:hypothetical protein
MSRRSPSIAFVPRNRLSKILSGMDRKAFAELVQNAEHEVQLIAPKLGESIGGDVQALIRLCRQDEANIFGQSREIGWLALRIVESARLADRPELAEAAEGVWEMIEALSARGVWHTDALKLHVEALQVLSGDENVTLDRRETITQALRTMRQTIGARDAG